MEITNVSAPGPIRSGEPFDLTIEHTTDCEGQEAKIRVSPSDRFEIRPEEARLEAGARTVVRRCTVTRKKEGPPPRDGTIRVSLGDSVAATTKEIT